MLDGSMLQGGGQLGKLGAAWFANALQSIHLHSKHRRSESTAGKPGGGEQVQRQFLGGQA